MKKIILILITALFLNISSGCDSMSNGTSGEVMPSESVSAEETELSQNDIVKDFNNQFKKYSELVACIESIDLSNGITISRSEENVLCYDLYGESLDFGSNEDYNTALELMSSLGILELHMPQSGKILFTLSYGLKQGNYIQGIMYAKDYEPSSSMEEKIVKDWFWFSIPST